MSAQKARKRRSRRPRPHLTHFEICRGGSLLLRLAIADDVLTDVGDELGALFKKLAPSTVALSTVAPSAPGTALVVASPQEDFVVSPEHAGDDHAYHAGLRERLADLFGSLCDASLEDALEIARQEWARRAEGVN